MHKKDVEYILKSLANFAIKNLPIRRVVAAICDKENVPMLILDPPPKRIDAKAMEKIVKAFGGELYPVMAIENNKLVIRYVEPQKVSNCSPVANKESQIPAHIFKDAEECIEIYKEVFVDKQPAILFFKKEGCKYCEELEYYLYKEGAGFSDEELSILEQVLGVGIVYIDADKCSNLKQVFGVRVFPALIYISDGKVKVKFERFALTSDLDKKRLRDFILAVYQHTLSEGVGS